MSARPCRSARSIPWASLSATVASVVAMACSSSPSGAVDAGETCPAASACPSAGAPSYKTVIVPILQQDCIPCHSPTGIAGHDQSTYAQVATQAGAIESQVATCQMPPLNGPQMTDAQRVALTAWLKCGAPNN